MFPVFGIRYDTYCEWVKGRDILRPQRARARDRESEGEREAKKKQEHKLRMLKK